MANFGSNVTTMSQPSLAGASFISPGVEDKSKAIAISNVAKAADIGGKIGIEMYKGDKLAEVEADVYDLATETKDRSVSATIFGANIPEENLSPVLKAFNLEAKKYQSAVEQGRMSIEELQLRLKSKLRTAVDNNPGLMNELVGHANAVLELSGAKDIIKADDEAAQSRAKADDEMRKYYMGIAKDKNLNVPMYSGGAVNMPELINTVNKVQEEDYIVESYKRKDSFTEEEVKSYGLTMTTGLINQTTNLAIQTLNDPVIPYEKAKLNINMLYDSVERDLMSDPRIARIADKPSVQNMLRYAKDQIKSVKEAFNSYSSKEDASKYLTNVTNIMRDNDAQAVMKIMNPQMIDQLSKLLALPAVQALVTSEKSGLKVQIYNDISKLLTGIKTDSTNLYEGKEPPAAIVVKELAKEAGKENSDKSVLALSNSLQSINVDIQGLDIEQAFSFYEPYVKALGLNASKEGLGKIDTESATSAMKHVNDYSVITLKDMQNTVNTYMNQGVKIKADIMADGRIMFDSDNPAITTELNKKYGTRINQSLSAIANLGGYSSTKDAAKMYYKTFESFFQ